MFSPSGLHRDKRETLKKARRVVSSPIEARGLPPLSRQPREGRILARLGGGILYDLISRERIRESRAQRLVEPLLRLSRWRDPIDREAHADRKIDRDSNRHDAAKQRPT